MKPKSKKPKARTRSNAKSGTGENATSAPSEKKLSEKKSQSGAIKLLIGCVVVLVVGFSARAYFSQQNAKQIVAIRRELELTKKSQNWTRAEVLAREWAAIEPSAYEPWQVAADAAMAQNNTLAAVQYLEAQPSGAPLGSYLLLSFLQMESLNDPLASKATLDETLEYYPDDPETHSRLLFYYTMTCQRNAIAAEARRAISVGSDTLATYAHLVSAKWLTFTNGFDVNQKWSQSYPDYEAFQIAAVLHLPSYKFLDELAKQAQGNAEEPPRPLEFLAGRIAELRAEYPDNLELLAAEIKDLCRNGEVKSVASRLAIAPAGVKEDNRFWRFKGWVHAAQQEWQDGQEAYDEALNLDPFDWESRLELAATLRAMKGVEAASEMQSLADYGKDLMFRIQKCPNIHALEPASLYDDLESYFRMCGEAETADRLRTLLDK